MFRIAMSLEQFCFEIALAAKARSAVASGHTRKHIPTHGKGQHICRFGRIAITSSVLTRLLAENLQLHACSEGEQRVDHSTVRRAILLGLLPALRSQVSAKRRRGRWDAGALVPNFAGYGHSPA